MHVAGGAPTEGGHFSELYYAKDHKVQVLNGRVRSLGCSPCTGAIRSDLERLPKIIAELVAVKNSERDNRVIDHDREGSIELKKREGSF